jgi:ABC-type antimicrobial peptide transport system permease subunit
VVEFSARIVYKLGFSELLTDMPVTDSLNVTQYFSLFLGLILNVVILILLLLSTMLIYSLLMVNVETRTFEMGVYRLVGATRYAHTHTRHTRTRTRTHSCHSFALSAVAGLCSCC